MYVCMRKAWRYHVVVICTKYYSQLFHFYHHHAEHERQLFYTNFEWQLSNLVILQDDGVVSVMPLLFVQITIAGSFTTSSAPGVQVRSY